jgi:hypothetical protein
MTLTVRLDVALEAALDRYCTERGVTKTLLVQESLAAYLVEGKAAADQAVTGPGLSAAYRAFADAGLIGAVSNEGHTADKAAVRARVQQRSRSGRAKG